MKRYHLVRGFLVGFRPENGGGRAGVVCSGALMVIALAYIGSVGVFISMLILAYLLFVTSRSGLANYS